MAFGWQRICGDAMTYLLRDIDEKLWARVKARATDDGLSLRMLLMIILRAYADGEITITASQRP